jgi:ribosome biogenesis GTPase
MRLESGNADSCGVIEAVQPRATEIARTRARKKHVVVANLDLLVVVVSVHRPALDRGLLDRLLATAERTGVPACVCLHKIDLAAPGEFADIHTIYERAGYSVRATSAVTDAGVAPLRDALRGHVSAFMGASGAGKSRLISRLQPGLELRTGMVKEKTGQGRHTTTRVDLHRTDFGALLADTPGVREFSLWHLPPERLRDLFPEFREIQEHCRFATCTHDHEPQCAIKSAVSEGLVDPGRHRSYLAILGDLRDGERAGAGRRKRGDRFA